MTTSVVRAILDLEFQEREDEIKALKARIAELEAPRLIRTVWRPVRKPGKGKKFQVVERSYQMRQVLDTSLYNHQIRIETYRRLDESVFEKETIEGVEEFLDPIEALRRDQSPKGNGTRRP